MILTPTSAAEPEAILSAIGGLHPAGPTNVQAGLELGYDVAELGHRNGALDRVVLASDGSQTWGCHGYSKDAPTSKSSDN